MTMLRDLWTDLVDKRLWPVALGLVVALVAVPLFLIKPAPDAPPAKPRPAATAPAPGAPTGIADLTGTGYAGPVKGDPRDPFRPQGGLASPAAGTALGSTAIASVASSTGAAAGASSPAGTGGAGGSTSSGSTGSAGKGGAGTGSTTPTKPPAPTVPPGVRPTAIAALQFGLLGGEPTSRRVAELTPLPSPISPAVVYLGQTRRGESAFLVSSDVTPTGQGRCLPNRQTCSTLYLKPGQVEYLTVATTAGQPIRYRLKFIRRLPS